MFCRKTTLGSLFLLAQLASTARGEDWPTYQHDSHRSAMTKEQLAAELELAWSGHFAPAKTAWPAPAKWDAYRGLRGLRSMRNYDPVSYVIVVGESLYFGSSADDTVRCLDAETGHERWAFYADGPVRVAPAWYEGKIYFGSDDGYAYCLQAEDGSLVWRFRPIEPDHLILNNGRFIPFWPCRSGVLVDGGVAYFTTGLLPWKESYLCALDAATGEPQGEGRFISKHDRVTMEGALLASSGHIFAPQGRLAPLVFDRTSGKRLGSLKGGGGCFVLVTADEHVLHGPGNKTGWITDSKADSRTQVATYRDGNAMVVSGDMSYLLTDYSLMVLRRSSREELWKVACTYPYGLILAGETLFVGGDDEVAAFDAKNGQRLWTRDVKGRAYGLAVANGGLFVSTDEGYLYCFRPSDDQLQIVRGARKADAEGRAPADAGLAANDLAKIEAVDDPGLLGRWVFHERLIDGHKIADLGGGRDGTIFGRLRIRRVAGWEAIELDGLSTSVLLAADHKDARLPRRQITVEAWVRIDEPLTSGGIIGSVKVDGGDQRGWMLGYVDSKLGFALRGKEGNGRLTYVTSKTDLVPKQWYHVAGTYDGREMRLYVDGQLQNASEEQRGPIHYSAQTFYEIGAYHDDDEYYHTTGMLHEVRVYDRALPADEVARHAGSKQFPPPPSEDKKVADALAELELPPYLEFVGSDTAVVRWRTKRPMPTRLEYGLEGRSKRFEDARPKRDHQATLEGLRPRRVYSYAIRLQGNGEELITPSYECDTHFNYIPADLPERAKPYPPDALTDRYRDAAQQILTASGIDRGICLVYGCGEGRLAYELAIRSRLRIVGVDTDAVRVDRARRALTAAGLYGTRVTVHHVESLDDLPFTSNFANLVVSDSLVARGLPLGSAEEVYRALCPSGGTALLGGPDRFDDQELENRLVPWLERASLEFEIDQRPDWLWTRIVRPSLEGAGEWSHQYARADNSAFGLENLQGARRVDDLDVQWLGRPGPRAQPDRNGRKPSPLAVGGRLFIQGLHRIIALDQYNGSILWSLETPQLERFNLPRDSSNWCADENFVYAAMGDRCWRIDAKDGTLVGIFTVTRGPRSDWRYDWGYVARAGNLLVGSAVKAGTAYTNFWGGAGAGWYDATDGPATYKVGSDNLFVLDAESGGMKWTYSEGVIINSTITVGDDSIYFVEARHPAVKAAKERRLGTPELWQQQFLVALDLETGAKRWERPIQTAEGRVAFYQAYGSGKLVIVASGEGNYHVYAFDAADGAELWNDRFSWPSNNHGGHMARPAIVDKVVYVRPYGFDLATGRRLETQIPRGKCGTYAATQNAFIFRGPGNLMMWDPTSGEATSWDRLRPDCWLSTVPAGGMLLSPEAGGGCSCGSWIETSFGFAPVGR